MNQIADLEVSFVAITIREAKKLTVLQKCLATFFCPSKGKKAIIGANLEIGLR
jgi:hypothetical protein